jgi:Mannose-6-phosphate isomerase
MLKRLDDHEFIGITEASLGLDRFFDSPHPYEQQLVKYIENDKSYGALSPLDYLEHGETKPIKVEGFERLNFIMFEECRRLGRHFNHNGPVSCHLFLSPKDSKSFTMHTDPDDVIIYMVQGRKVFESPDGQVELSAGDSLFIPRGTYHRAINVDSSIMLSFGLEQFLEKKL